MLEKLSGHQKLLSLIFSLRILHKAGMPYTLNVTQKCPPLHSGVHSIYILNGSWKSTSSRLCPNYIGPLRTYLLWYWSLLCHVCIALSSIEIIAMCPCTLIPELQGLFDHDLWLELWSPNTVGWYIEEILGSHSSPASMNYCETWLQMIACSGQLSHQLRVWGELQEMLKFKRFKMMHTSNLHGERICAYAGMEYSNQYGETVVNQILIGSLNSKKKKSCTDHLSCTILVTYWASLF